MLYCIYDIYIDLFFLFVCFYVGYYFVSCFCFYFFFKGKTAFCKLENSTTFLTLSAVHGNLHPNGAALAQRLLQPCVLSEPFCSSWPPPHPRGYSQFSACSALPGGTATSCTTAAAAESAAPRGHRAGGAEQPCLESSSGAAGCAGMSSPPAAGQLVPPQPAGRICPSCSSWAPPAAFLQPKAPLRVLL